MSAKVRIPPHLAIAHVLFIDVVGYSKLLVAEQRAVVEELNRLVRETPQFRKCEAGGKLIRIPAGDGMALVFFESPEQPAQCAVEIAKALKNHPQIRVRMGMHSGPVDEVKDVNNRSNVAGVGINMAQRVMACGDAGHILASKRVAEDLAQDRYWQSHLHELGEIELKHGVKFGIVSLYDNEFGNAELPEKFKHPYGESYPIPYLEGLTARAAGDVGRAKSAFLAARQAYIASLGHNLNGGSDLSAALPTETQETLPFYFPELLSQVAIVDAALGHKEEARREARRAVELRPISSDAVNGTNIAANLALVYSWIGERESAIEQLSLLLKGAGKPSYGELKLDPVWDSLRGDPRFEKLVEEAKQPVALK
jgi:tetratricopeptide (TPR) repeat protein